MQILVIGGTGFLGYHASLELAERGHSVTALGLPPGPPAELFPDNVKLLLRDIRMDDGAALDELLASFDVVVFAAGADDRAVPASPAAAFFYEANVRSTVSLTSSALRAGLKRLVILGSYFTYFDRIWPQMELSRRHPYIHSRKQQMELSQIIAGDDMAVVVLELPYIFGAMPGTSPLWTPLVNYVRSGLPLYYPRGGSNMVSVHRVAEAIAGACERVDRSSVFQVGDRNVSWVELLQTLCAIIGREDDTVHIVDTQRLKKMSWIVDAIHSVKGQEGGLHSRHFADILVSDAYFSPASSRRVLSYRRGGLAQAWRDTAAACPEGEKFNNWAKFSRGIRKLAVKKIPTN